MLSSRPDKTAISYLYQLCFPPEAALPCLDIVYALLEQHFRVIGLLELNYQSGPLVLGELIELPRELDFLTG